MKQIFFFCFLSLSLSVLNGQVASVDCKKIGETYSQFLIEYPDAHRTTSDDSATIKAYYDLLTGYFNIKLGFSKTYGEYKQFLDSCNIPYYLPSTTAPILAGPVLNMYVSGTDISSSVSCDSLNSIVSQFNSLFPDLSDWNLVSKKVKRILYPKLEYLLSCRGISKPYPTQQTVSPPYWIGSALRDSAYSSHWFKNNLTFVKFDVTEIPSRATVDSANLKISPVFTEPFEPGIYWSDMATDWDSTLTCPQLGSSYYSGPLPVFTPLYQYTSSQGNLVNTYLCLNKYLNYFKFPWFYKGNVLIGILNPEMQASNTATFVGTNNPIAQADDEAKPRLEVWLRVDTLYTCKDLVEGYFNSKLNSNLSFESLQTLYLQKCGVQLPISCFSDTPGENSSDNNNIIVYPNPAKNEVYIQFSFQPIPNLSYRIIDMSGRVTDKGTLNNYRLDLKKFSSGIYIIQLYDKGKIISTKKIFKH